MGDRDEERAIVFGEAITIALTTLAGNNAGR